MEFFSFFSFRYRSKRPCFRLQVQLRKKIKVFTQNLLYPFWNAKKAISWKKNPWVYNRKKQYKRILSSCVHWRQAFSALSTRRQVLAMESNDCLYSVINRIDRLILLLLKLNCSKIVMQCILEKKIYLSATKKRRGNHVSRVMIFSLLLLFL